MDKYREQAFEIFEEKGFPTTQLEEWRFTNLRPVLQNDYQVSPAQNKITQQELKPYLTPNLDAHRAVFINGEFCSELSQIGEEIEVEPLPKAVENEVFAKYYHSVVKKEEALEALNTALATDGIFVHVPHNKIVEKPLEVIYLNHAQDNLFIQPRNLYVLGKNAELKVVETHCSTGEQKHFTNAVTEIVLWENAHLDFYKTQNDVHTTALVDQVFSQQERDSVVSINSVSFGHSFLRNNLNFKQVGENCNSIMQAITIAADTQLIDHHTLVEHTAPNCESHELYRTILDDQAKGVFNGKIIVEDVAQKIDAFQQNNNILLTPTASIDTKPQLEIFADDVKCSHGCTVGQLDRDALFYMQQRGIPTNEARAFLLYAFSADVLESVKIPELKEKWSQLLAQKLNVELSFS